jgi:hypothetical protein
MALIVLVLVVVLWLVQVVLVRGDQAQRLNLASELAAGLLAGVVVAAAGLVWERRHEARLAKDAERKRSAVLRTITEYVGVELSPLGDELQLTGIDSEGHDVELFDSLEAALNAFRSPDGVVIMMREVGRRRSRSDFQVELLRRLVIVVPAFYDRLGRHIDLFLDHFIASGDHRTVGALLELWDHREQIPEPPTLSPPGVHEVLAHLEGRDMAPIVQQRAYLGGVVRMLLWYSELLRALDGIESGIPGRRSAG